MNKVSYVHNFVSGWELSPRESINELNLIIEGIQNAINELAAVGVDFDDLQELKDEFTYRITWYEND